MGYWLRDNSEEFNFSIQFKPISRFLLSYLFQNARHCNEYEYKSGLDAVEFPILLENTWTSTMHSVLCSYEFLTNCYLSFEYRLRDTRGYDVDGQTAQYYLDKFTPEFFQGKKGTVMVRVNVGF
jgi:hypothetical protein